MAADVVIATVAADAIAVATGVSTVRKQKNPGLALVPNQGGSDTKILERMSTKPFSRKNTDTTTPSDFFGILAPIYQNTFTIYRTDTTSFFDNKSKRTYKTK